MKHLAPKGIRRIKQALQVLCGKGMVVSLVPLSQEQLAKSLVNPICFRRKPRNMFARFAEQYLDWSLPNCRRE